MPQITHRFYEKTNNQQNYFLVKAIVFAIVLVGVVSLIAWVLGWYFLIFASIWIALSFLAPFIDTPSLKKAGKLIYYSPLFLVQPSNKKLVIHGGTLFDYLFVLNRNDSSVIRSRMVLLAYIQGMLALLRAYEKEPDKVVEGTSYIINKRTAQKVGLKQVPTNIIQKVIILFNYLVLTTSYSFVKSRLVFPRLSDVKTYSATIGDLLEKKYFLQYMEQKLQAGTN